jgi:hypothetical protein
MRIEKGEGEKRGGRVRERRKGEGDERKREKRERKGRREKGEEREREKGRGEREKGERRKGERGHTDDVVVGDLKDALSGSVEYVAVNTSTGTSSAISEIKKLIIELLHKKK